MLLSVWRLGGEVHGAAIQRELEETAGRSLSISGIHVTLGRLERKGLVRSCLGEPEAIRGGKARRLYSLEPAAVEALRAERALMNRLWDGLDEVAGDAGG